MTNSKKIMNGQAGITLTELLIVTIVIVIAGSLALLQFGSARDQLRRQNVSQQLKQAFERARFDSVKRRANAANRASVTVNTTSYTIVIDNNSNGVVTDAVDTTTFNFNGETIAAGPPSSITFPATVTFDQRGEITVSGGANPVFLVCSVTPCNTAANTASTANIVLVTPTGTVNLLAGGSTPPTFSAPINSTVAVGSGIDTEVVIP